MADELVQVVPDNTNQEPTQVELSPVEQRAMDQGWVPQDEWSGNPEDWRPAKEFVDRGELFKKIDEVRRENKSLKHAMEEFGKHHAKVRELEYKRAIETLKAQKKEAYAEGDLDAVVEIDDRLDEVKEQRRVAEAQPTHVETQADPVLVAWINKNPWYTTDRAMKVVADEVARDAFVNGERDNHAILVAVEKAIKLEFPHKFKNPNRDKAGAVEGSTNKASTSKDLSSDMTDAEKRIMDKIVRTGAITKEQYLKEYKATKGRGA